MLGVESNLGGLDATVSAGLTFGYESGSAVGVGSLRFERLAAGDNLLSERVQGTLRLTGRQIRIENLSGPVGDGTIRATAVIDKADAARNRLVVHLDHVPSATLKFVAPELAAQIDAPLDARLATTVGRVWQGGGTVGISRGKVAGAAVADVLATLDWEYIPKRGRGEIHVRELTGVAAQGRVTGKAELGLFADAPPRLAGEVRFTGVNVPTLFRKAGPLVGNLPLSGRFDFSSDRFQTLDDLTAKVSGALADARPFALPVFAEILPFVGGGRSRSTPVEKGEVRATLAKGVWRIQKLTLVGGGVDLHAEGTITTQGRLALDVVAGTGSFGTGRGDAAASGALGRQLTRALSGEVASVLSTVAVHLDVTGTVGSPAVRVKPLATISEEALKFFITPPK